MARERKKANKQEKLAKDRLRKKEKYAEIKKDPEKYRLEKEKERKKYLLRREKKKILSIAEMTDRQKRDQRKRWRTTSRKYLKKLKEKNKVQLILIDNSPPVIKNEDHIPNLAEPADFDPLMLPEEPSETTPKVSKSEGLNEGTSSVVRKMSYRYMKVISNLQKEIDKIQREKSMLRKQINEERQLKITKTIKDTIEKKVDQVIDDIITDKIESVKKKLLFSFKFL